MGRVGKLIPRVVAFRDPDRVACSLSPDGLLIAWLETRGDVLNLIVAPCKQLDEAKQITFETSRSITPLLIWAATNRHVIIFRDQQGDENYQAFSVDIESRAELPLTPAGNVRSLYWGRSPRFPKTLLFGNNARLSRVFDPVAVDVTTGQSELLFENPGFNRVHLTSDFSIRLGERVRPDGSVEIMERQDDGNWEPFLEIPPADVLTTRLERLSIDGRSAFFLDSRGRDKTALFQIDLSSRSMTLLAEDGDGDITDVVYHSGTERPLAAMACGARQRWHAIDPAFHADLEYILKDAADAEVTITGISKRMDRCLVFVDRSDAAGQFRLYERESRAVTPLFKNRSDLDELPLKPMQAITIVASDGLQLPSYLTLPDSNFRHGPMVLAVHGGPYDRDFWGYSPMHQWLASRGYAVLSVNFRGSTGFGKAFVNASDHEWGGRMQDDLTDAVAWAIDQGYAHPARIGFFGVSYGGYAALMAASKTPDTFACFIDVFGPSNLITFMEGIPPYWQTWFAMIKNRLADPETEDGNAWLTERSPLTHVDRIVRPIMIVQGLNDVRVRPRESEQMVLALRNRSVPVVYVTFSDEGHFFARQPNRIAFSAVMEAFLGRQLGGQCEPIDDALTGASIRIEAGKEFVLSDLKKSKTVPTGGAR